jgi:hypothetical protein
VLLPAVDLLLQVIHELTAPSLQLPHAAQMSLKNLSFEFPCYE